MSTPQPLKRTVEGQRMIRRAWRLRQLERNGGTLTDIDRAWLARYTTAAERGKRWATKPPPSVKPDRILAVVGDRYGVTLAELRRHHRENDPIDLGTARLVAILALVTVGVTHAAAGRAINRTLSYVGTTAARGRKSRLLRREVEQVLQVARVTKRGDLVWVTARVVVGDPLWVALDRAAEAAEVSEVNVAHRTARDRLRDAE